MPLHRALASLLQPLHIIIKQGHVEPYKRELLAGAFFKTKSSFQLQTMENAVQSTKRPGGPWPPERAGPPSNYAEQNAVDCLPRRKRAAESLPLHRALAGLLRPPHIIRQQGNVELCEPELPATSSSEPSCRLREMENAVNFLKCLNNSWPPESAGPLARPPLNAEMYLQ